MTTRSTKRTTRWTAMGLVAMAGMGLGGCSTSADYSGGAKKYIEGDLAKQIGLGDLTATCDDVPKDAEVGTTFNCSADTGDGSTIELVATVEEKDRVNVETTNLISTDGMTTLEQRTVALIQQQTGETLAEDALECGDGPRVIDVSTENLSCVLTKDDGGQYATTLTLDGLGADASVSVDIAAQPS